MSEERRPESAPYKGSAHDFGYLALARGVAEAAAQSTDLDGCLRLLRAGLVRIGFSRAGIWLIDSETPGFVRGTWGTGWHGEEVDEHALRVPVGRFVASDRVTVGEKVVVFHVEVPSDLHARPHQALILADGPPNCASVALRGDNSLLGLISVDMLPGKGSIHPHSAAMLELLADIAATAIARARLVTSLQMTNQALAVEVAERQQAEHKVVQRERRHRLLIESTHDVYAVINRDGTFQDISSSAERTFGYSGDEMIGHPFIEFVHPEDIASAQANFAHFVPLTGQRFSGEWRSRTKSRGWRTFEVVGANYLDDPAVNGIIVTCRDVTERRELEEQLRQAQKLEAIGQLAGGVAHEFNNLLTVINGYANLLADGVPDQVQERQAIEQIRRASESATKLTSQLLAFGRRQIVTLRETNLNAIVERSAPVLRRMIGEDIALEIQLSPALGTVKVDSGQIEQVLLTLGANARQAMPRGGTLTIKTANSESGDADVRGELIGEQGRRVLLSVSDTGLGMDKAALAHLFEPFFTTDEVNKGTNLGLAAVYGAVNQSGGTITVSNAPGQGTTFCLSFPRVDRAEALSPMRPRKAGFPEGDETVLLVEDEEDLRELVCLVLERSGYRVLAAKDGDHALALAEHYGGAIQLLVTDVVMPGLSGREVAEKLLQRRPSLRVLYTSGYTDDLLLRHGIRDGEVAFLAKPFSPVDLASKVRAVLDAVAR